MIMIDVQTVGLHKYMTVHVHTPLDIMIQQFLVGLFQVGGLTYHHHYHSSSVVFIDCDLTLWLWLQLSTTNNNL